MYRDFVATAGDVPFLFILKINETETSYYFTFVFDIIILGQGPYPFVMQLIHLFHKTKASVPYIASLLWELTSL